MEYIERVLKTPELISQYARALLILQQIGFIDWLKENAEPRIYDNGHDVQVMATQAARSSGYFECIRDVVDFEAKYIHPHIVAAKIKEVPRDFGGLSTALKEGHLTQEEIDEYTSNTRS